MATLLVLRARAAILGRKSNGGGFSGGGVTGRTSSGGPLRGGGLFCREQVKGLRQISPPGGALTQECKSARSDGPLEGTIPCSSEVQRRAAEAAKGLG